jgi:uncharacterized protein YggE
MLLLRELFNDVNRIQVLLQYRRAKMHQKITSIFLISFLFLSIAAYPATKPPEAQAAPVPARRIHSLVEPRTITVVGEGVVNLESDIVIINVGAEARANTVSEAKTEVDNVMEAISSALDWRNIADRDIQTSHYVIHYEREPRPVVTENTALEIQETYYVSNVIRVTIRDIDKVGDVLDAVVQAGANQVYGVTYTVSDKDAWRSLAQAQAMVEARGRAQELADLAGVELGDVVSVSEVIGGIPTPSVMGWHGIGGGGIVPSELEFRTQLEVTFSIR